MGRITGRSDDMLIIRGVNVFPTQIEEQLLRCARLAPFYRIEVTRPHRMDEVTIFVEGREGSTTDHCAGEADRLSFLVKTVVGISATVKVCERGSLERSEGKARHVLDLRAGRTAAHHT
jgi:phenylacetate-CoA ligase